VRKKIANFHTNFLRGCVNNRGREGVRARARARGGKTEIFKTT
jgi:hypothetical protein